MWRRSRVLLVLPLMLAGCFKNPGAPEDSSQAVRPQLQEDRMIIITDPEVLASRVTWTSIPLFVDPKEVPGHEVTGPQKLLRTDLTLKGEVVSPEVEGLVVQANDIDINSKTAMIAYNYAGSVFAGAMQIVDIRDADRPRVIAEVLYRNADVTAVCFTGDYYYVGLGSNDPALQSGAMVEEFYMKNDRLERTGRWIDLPSGVVTDLGAAGDRIIATVGAEGGGIAVIDRIHAEELFVEAWSPEEDVRGFDFASTSEVVAVCGTNPRMGSLHIPSMSGGMVEIDGYRNIGAKGTVEVYSDHCWLGSGDGGFQVRDAAGALIARLENDDFSDVRPELMVANAVTVSGNRAYVAGGALGVQVVDVTALHSSGADKSMRPMGELRFPDGISSNMIKVRNNIMIVAAGLGGVKLVHMREVRSDG